MKNIKNKIKFTLGVAFSFSLSFSLVGCSDWLDLLPNNEQVTDDYWQTKEDVENVVASGYYYLRSCVPDLLAYGELRASDFRIGSSSSDESKVQNFDILESNSLADYSQLYQVISMANSVIRYAGGVQDLDDTYYDALKNSHLCEALFLRAYSYSILVKNWKEVPLVTQAYVNDDADFDVAKSSESAIIAQIKADCEAAIATGAAKYFYSEEWQTKGRSTIWSIYALMCDICLWNHEYEECIKYADLIIKNQDNPYCPVFITDMNNWFDIFYPGNSNEGIFEVNWNSQNTNDGSVNNFTTKFAFNGVTTGYNFSEALRQKCIDETNAVLANNPTLSKSGRIGRMYLSSFITESASGATYNESSTFFSLWKYRGSDTPTTISFRNNSSWDANFIIYRVADVKLMKAEAEVMLGRDHWKEAIEQINDIRNRAGLTPYIDLTGDDAESEVESQDEYSLLTEVMDQRRMEFIGEGKRWYDILRLARYDASFAPEGTIEDKQGEEYESYKSAFGSDVYSYKEKAIEIIQECNTTTGDAQLLSVLQNSWAWYLPIPYSQIEISKELKQNPFYN